VCVTLPDSAEQKDVIVHREREQHREQEDRDPGFHAFHLLETEQVDCEPVLEDQDKQAVGRANGQ
jgi:hypothetical protein